MFPLLIISISIAYLILKNGIILYSERSLDMKKVEWRLNAIIFWGVLSVVLGLLGQFTGMYKGLSAISHAQIVNPRLVFQGLKESLTTTICGLTLLLVSGLSWFILNARYRKRIVADQTK